MYSENFRELMKLSGRNLSRINAVKKLLDDLDLLGEDDKRITYLFLSLSSGEKSAIKKFLSDVYDPTNKSSPQKERGNHEQALEEHEIFVSDVHRNEQVNITALCEGLQTILCSNLTPRTYYALWPMVGDSVRFKLNPDGEKYQWQGRNKYGERLDKFPRNYVASVYASARQFLNTVKLWEEMKAAGLFKYWDPEKGPFLFQNEAVTPEIQMLRVYKVDCDLNRHIKPNAGYRNAPLWTGGSVRCHGIPVLTDQQMEEQFAKFNQVLQNNGNPPAQRY